MSEFQEVLNRITVLETESSLKWEAHNSRSDERHNGLTSKMDEISTKLDNLPCIEHASNVILNTASRIRQEKLSIGMMLALIGGYVKLFFFNK